MTSGIGLLNEKPLHASLKAWCAQPGDRFEVKIDGFVIDIVRGDLLLEIQTGNFASIKAKLTTLVETHRVRLIYPVAQEKWIVKLAKKDGGRATRRRSPRRGRKEDLFWQLVSFPQLLVSRNFSLQLLMIREEEIRRFAGMQHWRKRGWVTEERRLLEVLDQTLFQTASDWRAFLPEAMEAFTAADLANATGVSRSLAQKMAYCLRNSRLIELVGKDGRANLYRVTD